MDKTPAPPLPLPEKFVDFLNDNGLDPSIYTFSDSIPRYIRCSSFRLRQRRQIMQLPDSFLYCD